MSSVNPLKVNAVADFATSVYRGEDAGVRKDWRGVTREEHALSIASDCLDDPGSHGILAPALRAKLDAMTQDYAKILTRIDQMAADARGVSRDVITTRAGIN